MNYIVGNIPLTQLLIYAVTGLLLLLFFNFFGRYIIPLLEKSFPIVNSFWQKIQILSWAVFIVLFYSTLLGSYTAITLISTIVFLGLSWEYWKNILAGVLMKFTDQLKPGDYISTDIVDGTVKTIFLARSELINEKGELVVVPNLKLKSSIITHLHKSHDVNICTFAVKTIEDMSLEQLYRAAHECPYIAVNQDINVERKSGDEWVVKATIIDNSFIDHANKYFRQIGGA